MALSILIPAYGNEQYIEQTIASLYSQSLPLFSTEIIIGIDGDPSLLNKIIDIRRDNRQTYNFDIFYCNENKGAYIMRNTLLKIRKKNNDVLFFDSDDVMNMDMLYHLIPETGHIKRFKYSMLKNDIEYNQPVYDHANGSLWVSNDAIETLGGYKDWRYSADTEFLKRAELSGLEINNIDLVLFKYRQHNKTLTSTIPTINRIRKGEVINQMTKDNELKIKPITNEGYFV